MLVLRRSFLSFVIFVGAAGCEHPSYEECTYTDDPASTSGARRDKCAPSQFVITTTDWRDVAGQVLRGENGVNSAVIRVEPTDEYASETKGGLRTILTTDAGGFFGPIRNVSLRYNASFRDGSDILLYRGVSGRYMFPSFDPKPGAARFAKAYSAGFAPVLTGPLLGDSQTLPANKALTFFATGEKAYDIIGSYADGSLKILGSEYSYPATIHALLHDAGGDLTTATAYAKVDLRVVANTTASVNLVFAPIPEIKETKAVLSATSSPLYIPGSIELTVGYSRTSSRKVGVVEMNKMTRIPAFPNHVYVTYRARVEASDGSVSDSGEMGFNIFQEENAIALPPAPVILEPANGSTVQPNDRRTTLLASGSKGGLYEHILVPMTSPSLTGQTTETGSVRIFTSSPTTPVPDLHALGATPTTGEYTWSVRAYPAIRVPEALGGFDGRRFLAFGVSSPRTLRFSTEQ